MKKAPSSSAQPQGNVEGTPAATSSFAPLAISAGEPAGIGPDLCVQIAQYADKPAMVVIADSALLQQRAEQLKLPLQLIDYSSWLSEPASSQRAIAAGQLLVAPQPLAEPVRCGVLNADNSNYVLHCLQRATSGCLTGEFSALVTAPLQKSIINEAGIAFSGHTEFLAEYCQSHIGQPVFPVMMLAAPGLRVALVTTHLPLSQVAENITAERIERVLRITHNDLQQHFGIEQPAILVCGLNPHAGENGHLGREELDIIIPTLNKLRAEGLQLSQPLPADTLFTNKYLNPSDGRCDAVVAMYHDQGLPVLKHMGFGQAVNITLGLPIIRTSVDHGTALDLAGSGDIDSGSMLAAIELANSLAKQRAKSVKNLSGQPL